MRHKTSFWWKIMTQKKHKLGKNWIKFVFRFTRRCVVDTTTYSLGPWFCLLLFVIWFYFAYFAYFVYNTCFDSQSRYSCVFPMLLKFLRSTLYYQIIFFRRCKMKCPRHFKNLIKSAKSNQANSELFTVQCFLLIFQFPCNSRAIKNISSNFWLQMIARCICLED